MKKLWKQEWRYYLFFALVVFLSLCIRGSVINYEKWIWEEGDGTFGFLSLGLYVEMLLYAVGSFILGEEIGIVFIFVVMEKGILYWLEKEEYGRNFLQFLPVKRRERAVFHLLMDTLLILCTVTGYAIFLYIHCTKQLTAAEIGIPWLLRSICGETVTAVCYLFFLTAVISFLECFFVNGFAKTGGSLGGFGMIAYTIFLLADGNRDSIFFQSLYGLFGLKAAGNCYYVTEIPKVYEERLTLHWVHDGICPPIFYKGGIFEAYREYFYSDGSVYAGDGMEIGRLYDFSCLTSYIGYALAYLGLALVLAGLVVWLSGKQELSKEGFYFSFGKYLLGAIISITFFAFSYQGEAAIWHKCLVFFAVLVLYVVLIYAMNPKDQNPTN